MVFSFQVAYLIRGGLHLRRSLFNKICDSSWLRYVDGVTSLDLNDRSTRALGHGTLRVRGNLVLGGDQVPVRLGPPRGFADRAANGPQAPRNLGVSHKRGFFGVYVGRERGGGLCPFKKKKNLFWGEDRRERRPGRGGFYKRPSPLAPFFSGRGGFDEGRNPLVVFRV